MSRKLLIPIILVAVLGLLLVVLKSSHRSTIPASPPPSESQAINPAPAEAPVASSSFTPTVPAPEPSVTPSPESLTIQDPLADADQRLRLIRQAGLNKTSDAVNPLIQALYDKNALLRGEAAEALGRIGNSRALRPLETALEDPDPTVRAHAASALGYLGRSEAVPKLVQALEANRNRTDGYGTTVCGEIIRSLGTLRNRSAVDTLVAEMSRQENLSYKNEVVRSLGMIGDPRAASTIRAHLDWLRSHQPTDPIAQFPWQQSWDTATEALHRLAS